MGGQDARNMKYTILIILGAQFHAINNICAAGWLSHHLFTAISKSSCLLPPPTALTLQVLRITLAFFMWVLGIASLGLSSRCSHPLNQPSRIYLFSYLSLCVHHRQKDKHTA